jgi:hypothetical protein
MRPAQQGAGCAVHAEITTDATRRMIEFFNSAK